MKKRKQIPVYDLSLKIRFFKKKDAQKAQQIIFNCLDRDFKGIKKMLLPAYNPDDIALK